MSETLKAMRRPDDFLFNARRIFGTLAKHAKFVYGVIVALVIVGIILAKVSSDRETKTQLGRDVLFKAQQMIEKEDNALRAEINPPQAATTEKDKSKKKDEAKPAQKAPVKSGEVQYAKVEVEKKYSGSIKALEDVLKEFPQGRVAFEANLSLGDLFFNHGKPAQASAYYEKAIGLAPGNIEKALALNSLAVSNEESGKFNEAIQTYEKVLAQGTAALKAEVYLGIARSYEGLKDNAKAKATYDKLIAEMPNSPQAKNAEIFKVQLQ